MIIHIMQDGTVRESVAGLKIQSKQFYQVLFEIQKKYEKNGATGVRT